MKKIEKLRICNWTLLFLSFLMLVSSVELELNPGGSCVWVWLHLGLGCLLTGFIFQHIGLHKNARGKSVLPENRHGHNLKGLGLLFLLTLISGIIAIFVWVGDYIHTTAGGIHGKIGFLFLCFLFFHVRKYNKFYRLPSSVS
ncbi:hypothetical protein [uncultured Duncaniella sp.]|uniref:hypothetical protein n=1 Tax=uncultured Duncaniella sp. TaxID=2768039 RepID=UPI00260966B5|nr:hypothetical protein [uncultured Duncaniella sp.]